VLGIELRRATEDGRPMAIFKSAKEAVGGALVRQQGREPTENGALVYLDANGKLEASLARVERAGGKVVMPKTDIGDPGFIALVHDTEGNLVGLHSERAHA
jgi:predicted enzyme related to lactoylglutathione lyase